MNLERLRAVQAQEREADSLRPLPDDFYRDVADYLRERRAERERAAESADDPFGSEEVRRLTDEIETAEEVAEAIYERRVGKLVKLASFAASDVPVEEEGLTAEEAELFADLVAQIEAHREEVLAGFAGGTPAEGDSDGRPEVGSAPRPPPEESESPASMDPGAAMGSDDEPDAEVSPAEPDPGEGPDPTGDDAEGSDADSDTEGTPGGEAVAANDHERVTLRITRDVGEVFGVDERTYDLAAEDVVTLPAANAGPLLDRDAAEEIK